MGALVVKEFADRGESARSANRPELQKMLAYLKEDGGIDYVIVHKLWPELNKMAFWGGCCGIPGWRLRSTWHRTASCGST